MNNPNPLIPEGSFMEQKNKSRSRVKVALFCVVGIHVVGLLVLLMQGCKREQPTTPVDTGLPTITDTNIPPMILDTNIIAPVAMDTHVPVVPPVVDTALPQEYVIQRSIYTERYMKLPQENAEGYQNSSPVHQAGQLKGKLLIAHGTGDDNVHFANTIQLTEEFIKAGKYAETMFYPARGHGISDTAAQIHVFRRVMQFFLDNL